MQGLKKSLKDVSIFILYTHKLFIWLPDKLPGGYLSGCRINNLPYLTARLFIWHFKAERKPSPPNQPSTAVMQSSSLHNKLSCR